MESKLADDVVRHQGWICDWDCTTNNKALDHWLNREKTIFCKVLSMDRYNAFMNKGLVLKYERFIFYREVSWHVDNLALMTNIVYPEDQESFWEIEETDPIAFVTLPLTPGGVHFDYDQFAL